MRQSEARKDMNTEAEESTALETFIEQRLLKTQQTGKT
jgi:hypothetical protein